MEKSKISKANTSVWDCGSTLYDSYELNSFKSQLSAAIANSPRSLSMPHLPQRYHHHHQHDLSPVQQQPSPTPSSHHCMFNNKSFKISRSFQKLLRFIFKGNKHPNNSNSLHKVKDNYSREGCFYVVYDKSDQPVLSTIPELPEFEIGGLSPETSSLVRKSASERFSAISTVPAGIYAKVHYGTSLSNVDWLHGGAESLLTITNLFIVLGLRMGLRKAGNAEQSTSTPNSELKEK